MEVMRHIMEEDTMEEDIMEEDMAILVTDTDMGIVGTAMEEDAINFGDWWDGSVYHDFRSSQDTHDHWHKQSCE